MVWMDYVHSNTQSILMIKTHGGAIMKRISKGLLFGNLFLLLVVAIVFLDSRQAFAATTIKIQSVNYYDETIQVRNGTNNKIYYADEAAAKKNDWEVIPVDSGTYTTIDTSYMLPAIDNVLLVKGDVDSGIARITVKHKPYKLNVSINYSYMDDLNSTDTIADLVNIMTSEGTGKSPITFDDLEWKKNLTGQWTDSQYLTVDKVDKYLVKGTYLYFRIKAINDNASGTYYPNGAKGRRFSDEVKLRIEKMAPPVVSGIDGSKMKADIKPGKEYRVSTIYSNGTVAGSSGWIKVMNKGTPPTPLETIINNVVPRNVDSNNNEIDYDGKTVAFPQMKIEVRNYATAKTAASKISETNLNPQRSITNSIIQGVPAVDAIANGDDNIYVSYNGNQNIVIYCPAATTAEPYEYCVTKKGENFNFDYAAWTTISKGTGQKVLASKAIDGGTLYVRKKEIKYKAATSTTDAVAYALASTYVSVKINYPSVPAVTKSNLTYMKGYGTPTVFKIKLNDKGKDPYETTIKNIKLGTKDIRFTVTTAPSPTEPTVKIMTVTLNEDDIKSIPNCTNRPLTITFMNGTVDKTAVILTITSPTPSGTLNITPEKGASAGMTKITVNGTLGSGNIWVYDIGTSAVIGKNTVDTLPIATGTAFESGDSITVTANQYITIYELDAKRNIIKFKCIQISAGLIM